MKKGKDIFQFLLVQLKDAAITNAQALAVISIPTGSIKSLRRLHMILQH